MVRRYAMGMLLALLATGCGQGAAPGPAPAGVPSAALPAAVGAGPVNRPAPPLPMPKEPEAGPPLPPMAYDAKGRRDPFIPISLAPERKAELNLGPVKLVGIMRAPQGLMALVETPDGLGYILKVGDVLGDSRVSQINSHSITFTGGGPGLRAASLTLRLVTD
ncbi:MAG: hypothetical protein ACREMG_03740 [Gemmatimonadales bacterium]